MDAVGGDFPFIRDIFLCLRSTLIMNNTTGLSINDNIFGKMSTWTFSYFDDPPRVGSMASSCFSKWGVGLNFIQCWLASLVW